MAAAEETHEEHTNYPLQVHYCGVCTMPLEYCEYGGELKTCREWLQTNLPEVYEELTAGEGMEKVNLEDGKAKQKRGGKALKKAKKKEVEQWVKITQTQRSKKKYVTVVTGLRTFEIDLKKASKQFAQRFSCGSSVTGEDEIVVQGEVAAEMLDFIQQTWPEIDDDHSSVIESKK